MFVFFLIFALGTLLGPFWAQDRPKPLQDAFLDRAYKILTPQLGGFWENVGTHLGRFWAGLVPTT